MIPCGLKKRTILIVIGKKTSILTQFGVGSRCSEKGEVLLFWFPRQERGRCTGVSWAAGTQSRGHCHSHWDTCSLIEWMSHCAAYSGSFSMLVMGRFDWTWYKPTVFVGFLLSALNFRVLLENVLILKSRVAQKEVDYWVPNRENCGWRQSKWVRYK